jgi:YD repeat-containing protein
MPKKTEQEKHLEGEVHEDVGVPHGHVDENGETIVYEYDDDGNFTGWHKEA